MAQTHLNVTISQKALITFEGKLLLVLEDEWWELPGGRVDEGETDLKQALQREIREELSLEINPTKIFTTYLFQKKNGSWVLMLIYECEVIGSIDSVKIKEDEILDFKLFTKEELKELKNIFGNSIEAISSYLSH